MELTRREVLHLGLGSKSFLDSFSNKELKDKFNISGSTKMILELNYAEVEKDFSIIAETEKDLARENFGVQVGNFGYQFFDSKESLDDFENNIEKFQEDLNKSLESKDENKVKKVLKKYLPNDSESQKKSFEKFIKSWNEFLDDEEGIRDFKVRKLKPEWFENTDAEVIPDSFFIHYNSANLIDY